MTTRRILTILLLAAVLFGMPIGSWFYLRDGVRYRKEKLAQLKDFGKWGADLHLTNWRGEPFTTDSLRGNITVVCAYDPAATTADTAAVQLERFQKAFGPDRRDIHIISLPFGAHADSATVAAFAAKHHANPRVWHLLHGDANHLQSLLDGLHIAQNTAAKDGLTPSYFALIDTNLVVRQYYLGTNKTDVNKLIQIVSMIMRPSPTAKIKYRRREEK